MRAADAAPESPPKGGSLDEQSSPNKDAAEKGEAAASDEDFESFPALSSKNPNASASQDEPPPQLPPLLPPPPPAGWRWPREGDCVEIEVEEEGATLWRPATVVSVTSIGSESGWFSARMLHDDEWVDWFTWQEEGKDWRRTGGKRKLSATAPKLAEAAEAAEAEAAAEEAGADQKAAKKAAVRKSGAVAGATAEGENDEAALVTALVEDCGECTNCLDKRKFGGPGLKKQKCKEPVPAGTRAAAAAAAAVALEARACAAEPKREPSLLGEPKRYGASTITK